VLSATAAGVKELREVVEAARRRRSYEGRGTLVFVDEIHRFNKGQQDVLLPHLEAGVCALVGATTENPSFEVNAALLSRVRVLQLRPLEIADIVALLRRALDDRSAGSGRARSRSTTGCSRRSPTRPRATRGGPSGASSWRSTCCPTTSTC
jgi:putative ATPase